jgi:hypothetical protein
MMAELVAAGKINEAINVIERGYRSDDPPAPNPQTLLALAGAWESGGNLSENTAAWLRETASAFPVPVIAASRYKILKMSTGVNPAELEAAAIDLKKNYPDLAEQLGAN